jgi:hypothetical protein
MKWLGFTPTHIFAIKSQPYGGLTNKQKIILAMCLIDTLNYLTSRVPPPGSRV